MNSLESYLVNTPQREIAGTIAADRFDYQKDWALAKLLSLHASSQDYVLLCEFHEDVTVIDKASGPASATFYQIKTDDNKHWTVNRLTKRRKGKTGALPSILGKLCDKVAELKGSGAHFHFVTNSSFSIKSGIVHKPEAYTACTLLSELEWKNLIKSLEEELGIPIAAELNTCLVLEISELPLLNHATTALGMVADFLEKYAPGHAITPGAFYRSLFDELKRRTNAEKPKGSLPEICESKGLDRPRLDRMLKDAIKIAPSNGAWSQVRDELRNDGVALPTRLTLNEAYKTYYIRSLSAADAALRRDRRILSEQCRLLLDAGSALKLYDLAIASVAAAKKNPLFGSAALSDLEAQALTMVTLYERNNDEVSVASS